MPRQQLLGAREATRGRGRLLRWACALVLALRVDGARAADAPSYGAELEGFAYPHPVKSFALQSQRQSLRMAYLDVPAEGTANGRTAVLLHGKNLCAASWAGTIEALSAAGFRVIAPDWRPRRPLACPAPSW